MSSSHSQVYYYFFVKCHVFCSIQIFIFRMKINICKTLLYLIVDNVSLSFEENSENDTNVERLNNNLELLDVT